jgi:hypothetical protein
VLIKGDFVRIGEGHDHNLGVLLSLVLD